MDRAGGSHSITPRRRRALLAGVAAGRALAV